MSPKVPFGFTAWCGDEAPPARPHVRVDVLLDNGSVMHGTASEFCWFWEPRGLADRDPVLTTWAAVVRPILYANGAAEIVAYRIVRRRGWFWFTVALALAVSLAVFWLPLALSFAPWLLEIWP